MKGGTVFFVSLFVIYAATCIQAKSFLGEIQPCPEVSSGPVINLQQLDINPDPVLYGGNLVVTATLTDSDPVTGGVVHVMAGTMDIMDYKLCDIVKPGCDIPANTEFTIEIVQEIKEFPGEGPIPLKLLVVGDNNEAIFCGIVSLDVQNPPAV